MSVDPGVVPTSPTGSTAEPTPSPAGDPGSNNGEGRTLENVRGEFLRKLEKSNEDLRSEITSRMDEMVSKLTDAIRGNAPRPAPVNPAAPRNPYFNPVPMQTGAPASVGDLSDVTTEQLQAVLDNPAAMQQLSIGGQQAVKDELSARRIDARTQQRQTVREREAQFKAIKARSLAKAQAAFPALRDTNSEMFKSVGARLRERRAEVGEVPHDIWDVANEIAREMRIEPQTIVRGGFSASGNSDGDAPARDPVEGPSDERVSELARRFESSLGRGADGKPRKFNMDRLKARRDEYGQAADLYKSRGMRVAGRRPR